MNFHCKQNQPGTLNVVTSSATMVHPASPNQIDLFYASSMGVYLHFCDTTPHTKTSQYTPNPQSFTLHHSWTCIQIILPVVDNDELRIGKDVGKLPAIAGSHLGSCGLHCCSWQLIIFSFPVSLYPVAQEALYSDWLKEIWWRATVLAAGLSLVMHDSTRNWTMQEL